MNKVAVITRTKDRSVFLRRALESVANQTYKDYVHVVVNDGGAKAPVEALVAALPESQRAKVKLFHRKESSGAPDTIFNESIDRVDSEYFALHDDDDSWHSDFLKETVRELDDNGDLGACVVPCCKITEKLKGDSSGKDTIVELSRVAYMSDMRAVSLYRQCADNQMTPIATLYRRAAYERVGKFDSTLPILGDWEFGVRLLMKYEVSLLDSSRTLAMYHHRRGASHSFSRHSHATYHNLIANRYLREELEKGVIGPGYIMSKIKYNQGYTSRLMSGLLPTGVISRLKKRVRD